MSNEKNNGGPAFPTAIETYPDQEGITHLDAPGMTLRDYFAAKAMQGIVASRPDPLKDYDGISRWAYKYADAMLKAREA